MFKRLLLILPLILICGCAPKSDFEPNVNNISFRAKVDFNDENFIFESKAAENCLKLTVSSPKMIEGLCLTVNQNGVQTDFKGLKYKMDSDKLPQALMAKILCDIFEDVGSVETVGVAQENCIIDGKVGDSEYSFVFSPSGLPISLSIKKPDIKIQFNNVTIIKSEGD